MFTGIVRGVGVVDNVLFPSGHEPGKILVGIYTLVIKNAKEVLKDSVVGDSIAVDGVCLTAVTIDENYDFFSAELCPETLMRTNLGYLKPGDQVNLERSLSLSEYLGGHVVQGHVDTTADVVSLKAIGAESYLLTLEIVDSTSRGILPLISRKGYVSVNGISLSVVDVNHSRGQFSFNIIPETWRKTNLRFKKEKDKLNIEVDSIAKMVSSYIENALMDPNSVLMAGIEKIIEKKVTGRGGASSSSLRK